MGRTKVMPELARELPLEGAIDSVRDKRSSVSVWRLAVEIVFDDALVEGILLTATDLCDDVFILELKFSPAFLCSEEILIPNSAQLATSSLPTRCWLPSSIISFSCASTIALTVTDDVCVGVSAPEDEGRCWLSGVVAS